MDLSRAAGLNLDPWQAWSLEMGCSEARNPATGRMRWAAFEVAEMLARQNGKGAVIEGRELAALALFGERVQHSAHHYSTTRDAFERMTALVENCPDLDRMVSRITTGAGNQAIRFRTGGRIEYGSRKRGSGRGLPPDVLVNDEAFDYPEASHSALMPSVSARPNPQVWYLSSPPDEYEHPNSVVIARLRQRALRGNDPRLMYVEWSAAEAEDLEEVLRRSTPEQVRAWLADRDRWVASNPALGYRITEETIERELTSMSVRGFAVERLGIGYWPDPEPQEDTDDRPVDPAAWAASSDPRSVGLDPVALAIDVAPDGTTALAAVGWREDGRKHAELIEVRQGTGWVPAAVVAIVEGWDPSVLVVDASSPAAALVPRFQQAGLDPLVTTGAQLCAAAQGLVIDLNEDGLRVRSCKPLDDAAESARWRQVGDRRAFDRRRGGANIAPLVAVSLAGFGLDTVTADPPTRRGHPDPEPITSDGPSVDGGLDLATVGF